jgi:glycogen operon protein
MRYRALPGHPSPFGANPEKNGTNFSLFSKNAVNLSIEIFTNFYDETPVFSYTLDPIDNKTGNVWHVFIEGVEPGDFYGYRVFGPYLPEKGHRFNPNKLLTDPYAKANSGEYSWDHEYSYGYDKSSPMKDLSFSDIDSAKSHVKSIVVDNAFDWNGDKPLRIPMKDTIIYEMHVRLFTKGCSELNKRSDLVKSSSEPSLLAGTFEGMLTKRGHLQDLGVTSIELMPIFEFNPNANIHVNPETGEQLKNIWGYDPLAFFSVEGSYTPGIGIGEQVVSLKQFVKTMHLSGFEIIIDVVFNHTGEGNHEGPTLSFRGIDNQIYYLLNKNNPRFYENYSGCGNTLNCNHPVVKQLILDSLRYWVTEMHIDGFRFDLAAILGRAPDGKWIGDLSLLKDIAEDPILAGTKLIAEGWDAAGGYYVGDFPQGWAEWNGKYRDIVRRFIRGDEGTVPELATRIAGSSDLYNKQGRKPFDSINFVTAHDGFTLMDLVSYSNKHNVLNGENNHDGANDNYSSNCGIEGETSDPDIQRFRRQQIKNFITILMVSQGTPMVFMGDEMGRTQKGNNNAYCHDNSLTWVDWSLMEKNRELFDYYSKMIFFRKRHECLRREHFFTGKRITLGVRDITWHGVIPYEPDWSATSRTIAFVISGEDMDTYETRDNDIYVALNAYSKHLSFELPVIAGKNWFRIADTSLPRHSDFYEEKEAPAVSKEYLVKAHSSIILISKREKLKID